MVLEFLGGWFRIGSTWLLVMATPTKVLGHGTSSRRNTLLRACRSVGDLAVQHWEVRVRVEFDYGWQWIGFGVGFGWDGLMLEFLCWRVTFRPAPPPTPKLPKPVHAPCLDADLFGGAQ